MPNFVPQLNVTFLAHDVSGVYGRAAGVMAKRVNEFGWTQMLGMANAGKGFSRQCQERSERGGSGGVAHVLEGAVGCIAFGERIGRGDGVGRALSSMTLWCWAGLGWRQKG